MLKQLKSAVLGSQIERDYEIGKQIGSGGPGYRWTMYSAIKKTNHQEYTIFKYTKTPQDKTNTALPALLKRDPTQLGRLRHPCLLELEATVDETSDGFMYVTEPLLCSLGNALGRYENIQPLPVWLKEYELDEVEIQCGLLQVAKGLQFLHSDAKMIHLGISPEAIFINKNGEWKIGGFSFSQYASYQSNGAAQPARIQYQEWDSMNSGGAGGILQPQLNYAAPECVYNSEYRLESDIFSFGVLIFSCFNRCEPLFECRGNVMTYKQKVSGYQSGGVVTGVPQGLANVVSQSIQKDPARRPTAAVVTTCPYFESMLTSTIKYLDALVEKEDVEKAEFLKNLINIVPRFSQRVQRQRILPALLEELKTTLQIPFVLPNVFIIAEGCNKREFQELVFPALVPVFRIEDPIQVVLILMQRMDLLLQKTGPEDMKNVVLPMIYRSLDSPSTRIQELCSKILPDFAPVIEYGSLKNSVFPRLVKTVVKCESVPVKINFLVCLGKLMELMDKFTVVEKLLPALGNIDSHEPGILMAMLGLYDEMVKQKNLSLDKDEICRCILPRLLCHSIDPNLNVKQFQMYMGVIKSMVAKVETEQSKKLIQMAKMDEQTTSSSVSENDNNIRSKGHPSVDTEQRMRSLLSETIPMDGTGPAMARNGSVHGSFESVSSSSATNGSSGAVGGGMGSLTPTMAASARPMNVKKPVHSSTTSSNMNTLMNDFNKPSKPKSNPPMRPSSGNQMKSGSQSFTHNTTVNNGSYRPPVMSQSGGAQNYSLNRGQAGSPIMQPTRSSGMQPQRSAGQNKGPSKPNYNIDTGSLMQGSSSSSMGGMMMGNSGMNLGMGANMNSSTGMNMNMNTGMQGMGGYGQQQVQQQSRGMATNNANMNTMGGGSSGSSGIMQPMQPLQPTKRN
eukprot:Nk52_evm20s2449 gene=Nk52_evmTU20s2449